MRRRDGGDSIANRVLDRGDRPGRDRTTVEPATQVVGEVAGRLGYRRLGGSRCISGRWSRGREGSSHQAVAAGPDRDCGPGRTSPGRTRPGTAGDRSAGGKGSHPGRGCPWRGRSCSGAPAPAPAAQGGVPLGPAKTVTVWSGPSSRRAMPKSATLGTTCSQPTPGSPARRMLAGFRSRCRNPHRWI